MISADILWSSSWVTFSSVSASGRFDSFKEPGGAPRWLDVLRMLRWIKIWGTWRPSGKHGSVKSLNNRWSEQKKMSGSSCGEASVALSVSAGGTLHCPQSWSFTTASADWQAWGEWQTAFIFIREGEPDGKVGELLNDAKWSSFPFGSIPDSVAVMWSRRASVAPEIMLNCIHFNGQKWEGSERIKAVALLHHIQLMWLLTQLLKIHSETGKWKTNGMPIATTCVSFF